MEYFLIIGVVLIFVILNKGYNSKDYRHIKVNVKQDLQGDLKDHEAGLLIALMAKVAKADGQVCELEAEILKNTFSDISNAFNNSEHIRAELKNIYANEKESFNNTVDICNKYYKLTSNSYEKRLQVMQYLLNLAFIDADFSDAERMIVEDIANAIKIKENDLNKMINEFASYYSSKQNSAKLDLENAYKIIEADSSMDDKLLKKQYRALVKKYHPDIVTGKGANQATIDEATKKLQEINEAYEIIKQSRNI